MSLLFYRQINAHLVLAFNTPRLTDPATISELEREVAARLEATPAQTPVVVSFEGVEFVSSQVVGLLIGMKRRVHEKGGTITLCRLNKHLSDVLKLMKIDAMFRIAERVRDVVGPIDMTRRPRQSADRRVKTGAGVLDWID